uniref:Uncharacterized protein n=1 Tax=Oncorhynchus kisutch TaxID=8019 RepID=A0A8C7CR43_ONCKI
MSFHFMIVSHLLLILHKKIQFYIFMFEVITCDKNLNRCCELVKLTSKIQGQLFTILNLTAREGGHYAGVDVLKSRLLPWLGICFPMATSSVTNNTSLNLIQVKSSVFCYGCTEIK